MKPGPLVRVVDRNFWHLRKIEFPKVEVGKRKTQGWEGLTIPTYAECRKGSQAIPSGKVLGLRSW